MVSPRASNPICETICEMKIEVKTGRQISLTVDSRTLPVLPHNSKVVLPPLLTSPSPFMPTKTCTTDGGTFFVDAIKYASAYPTGLRVYYRDENLTKGVPRTIDYTFSTDSARRKTLAELERVSNGRLVSSETALVAVDQVLVTVALASTRSIWSLFLKEIWPLRVLMGESVLVIEFTNPDLRTAFVQAVGTKRDEWVEKQLKAHT